MNRFKLCGLVIALAFIASTASGKDQPNIVIFLVDDMGVMDTSRTVSH